MAMPEMKEGGVNVTPLIDIVMCLIIFFMLVTKIGVKTGEDASITPAETVVGRKLESLSNTCTLNIHNIAGQLEPTVTAVLDNQNTQKAIPLNDPGNPNNPRPLLTLLKQWKDAKGEQFRLILNVDAETPFSQTCQVYGTIGEAGILQIAFQQKKVAE